MAETKRSNARSLFWIGFLLLLVGFAPLLVGMLGIAIIDATGCTVSEGYAAPCIVAGMDISGLLQNMTTAIWFMFFTFLLIPIGAIAWLVSIISWLKNRNSPAA